MKVRIAAMGDIHIGKLGSQNYKTIFEKISSEADVLLLCGDLTTHGLVEDVQLLADQLTTCTVPVLAVLGNHDYEAGQQDEITSFLQQHRVQVLQGESTVIENVAFAGVKGFCGGFDTHVLSPFGEKIVKDFVQETLNETLMLEKALGSVPEDMKKIAFMHYSPIRETVLGEHPDIIAFLGSSRLMDPIERFKVEAVFHGHAHNGHLEGVSLQNIPVYNVAAPLLLKHQEDPYKLLYI